MQQSISMSRQQNNHHCHIWLLLKEHTQVTASTEQSANQHTAAERDRKKDAKGSSLVTNQEAMLTQALLHSIQCTIQLLLGPVI